MRIKKKIILGYSCMRSLLFRQKIPLIVSWGITKRCNLRCKYCNVWSTQSSELPTSRVLEIIKALSLMGTRLIRFTGGEPLLREDIDYIINYARKLGISVGIATNGVLLPYRIQEIEELDAISLSLDGPEDTHDSIRGKGTQRMVIKAIEMAKRKNMPATLVATLNCLNLSSIDYILDIANQFRVKVFFQPVTKTVLYGEQANPLLPDVREYRKIISDLIRLKKKNRFLGNSVAGLQHLSHWPDKTDINCVAGMIICRLDSEGNLRPCPRADIQSDDCNVNYKDVRSCFQRIKPLRCRECWCSLFVELNLISALNISAAINVFR